MKKTMWLVLLCLLFAGLAEAKDYMLNKNAGDLAVTVRIDRNPPVVGNNNLEIGLKDASGREVTDARVTVDYGMAAMSGMPAVNYKANAQLRGGRYNAAMKLSMAGPWTVTVKIYRPGKIVSTRFTVDAR